MRGAAARSVRRSAKRGGRQPEEEPLSLEAPETLRTREAGEAARRARLKGIGLMCLALFCFACLDTTAKWLNTVMDPLQIVWARYTSALVFVLIIFNPVRNPRVLVTRRPWVQLVRSALLFGSTATNFIALQYLQLDQTMAIIFGTPLLVALLAGPFLGEWVGPRRAVAIAVGFVGVLMVTQPWSGRMHWAVLLSVGGALCYGVYMILTRMLAGMDSAGTTSIYSVAFGALAASLAIPFVWAMPSSPVVLAAMLAIGALGAFGHWLLILAHNAAPAPVLAPFIYTQLVWMIGFGALVFGQYPAPNTLAGSVVVIASGLYLIHRERVVKAGGQAP